MCFTEYGVEIHGAWLFPGDVLIPPLGTVSVRSVESISMPNNMVGFLKINSILARVGIILVTDLTIEPGYADAITLRLFNSSDRDCIIDVHNTVAIMMVERLYENSQ